MKLFFASALIALVGIRANGETFAAKFAPTAECKAIERNLTRDVNGYLPADIRFYPKTRLALDVFGAKMELSTRAFAWSKGLLFDAKKMIISPIKDADGRLATIVYGYTPTGIQIATFDGKERPTSSTVCDNGRALAVCNKLLRAGLADLKLFTETYEQNPPTDPTMLQALKCSRQRMVVMLSEVAAKMETSSPEPRETSNPESPKTSH